MKLTFKFQTLILLTLTLVLSVATAVWGSIVYNATYDIILHGFDQKLTALSVGAGEFTDGDGHAEYQRPRQIRALTAGRDGQLWGFDSTQGGLVTIDPADGGALALAAPRAAPVRSMAFDALQERVALLSGDGLTVYASLDQATLLPVALPLAQPIDELLFVDGVLIARRGRELSAVETDAPLLTLEEDVSLLNAAPLPASYVGMASADSAVVLFDAGGKVIRRVPLQPATFEVHGLAFVGDTLYAAATSLLRIDLDSGAVAEDFAPGFFSEDDPWYARYRPHYIKTNALAGLTFLYTEVYLGENQIRYVMDGSEGDDHSAPGAMDEVPPESIADVRLAQLTGQAFVSDIREWEEWGLIKVSAAPIYGSDGRVVALAGADVDIGVIRNKTRFALFAVLFVGAALLVLAGSVSYRVSQGLTRPLRDIKDSALRIAAGYHGTRVAHESSDEIGQLAQSLNALSTRLAARARQSQTYQQALNSGREQVALQHAVAELLEYGGGMATPRMLAERTREDSAWYGDGRVALLWRLAKLDDEAVTTQLQHVRLQRLAAVLLARQNANSALASLYMTMPNIAAIACWEAATGRVEIRCREPLTLARIAADGSSQPVSVHDSMDFALAPGEHLDWLGAVTLQGPDLPQAMQS
jgi:HAMP domain-containing protein